MVTYLSKVRIFLTVLEFLPPCTMSHIVQNAVCAFEYAFKNHRFFFLLFKLKKNKKTRKHKPKKKKDVFLNMLF